MWVSLARLLNMTIEIGGRLGFVGSEVVCSTSNRAPLGRRFGNVILVCYLCMLFECRCVTVLMKGLSCGVTLGSVCNGVLCRWLSLSLRMVLVVLPVAWIVLLLLMATIFEDRCLSMVLRQVCRCLALVRSVCVVVLVLVRLVVTWPNEVARKLSLLLFLGGRCVLKLFVVTCCALLVRCVTGVIRCPVIVSVVRTVSSVVSSSIVARTRAKASPSELCSSVSCRQLN